MKFDELIGRNILKNKLISAVKNNKIPHAQLFHLKQGNGGLDFAMAYATYLNCENPTMEDSCGQCASCLKNKKLVHPDVHFIFPLSSTKSISSDKVSSTLFLQEWRDFCLNIPYGDLEDWQMMFGGENKQLNISKRESREIIKTLSLKTFEGKYKIIIIWLPEFMHHTTSNALLKIIEEPPTDTIFILISYNIDLLLPTIISRTQLINIPNFSDNEIKMILQSHFPSKEEDFEQIVPFAKDNLRKSLRFLERKTENNFAWFHTWMQHCFKKNYSFLVDLAEDYHKRDKKNQQSLLIYSLTIFREVLINNHAPNLNNFTGSSLTFIEKFGQVLNNIKIENMVSLVNDAIIHLERNASPKIIFLDLSLNVSKSMKS